MIGILGAKHFALALVTDREVDGVSTEFGDQLIERGLIGGTPITWIRSFGWDKSLPAHLVNQRAQMMAFATLEVTRIITINGFGGVKEGMQKGDLVVPDDYIKFDAVDHPSILAGSGWPRVDVGLAVGGPFCPELRLALIEAIEKTSTRKLWKEGVIGHVKGPHLETKAEAERARKSGADMLSTALYPRVVYARELGMCFASFCWSSDTAGEESVKDWWSLPVEELKTILARFLTSVPPGPSCPCQQHHNEIWSRLGERR